MYVEHCHTLDGEWTGTGFDLALPTAVASDGSTSFMGTELTPGGHGSDVSWSVDGSAAVSSRS